MTLNVRIRARVLATFLACATAAHAADPKLPAGQDPGGIAVALIGGGVDYTAAKIAPRMARDGEGELIGWDLIDEDRAPFAPMPAEGSAATPDNANVAAEMTLAAYAKGRLVPVRTPAGDPQALAKAIAFIAGTPARIIGILHPLDSAALRTVIRQASERFRDSIFVVYANAPAATAAMGGMQGMPGMTGMAGAHGPSVMNLGNVLVVTPLAAAQGMSADQVIASTDMLVLPRGGSMFGANPAAPPHNGAEAVALAAAAVACRSHGKETPLAGSAAKAATLDVGRPLPGTPALRALDPMCWYGGQKF